MKISRCFLGFQILLFVLAGCASAPQIGLVEPQGAFLANEDVVITSIDGSWSITPGERFVPQHVSSTRFYADYLGKGGDSLLAYTSYLSKPAFQKVKITKAGYEDPFYGILLFSKVLETGDALARRRWQVAIPEQYFRSAQNAGISVVYAPYRYEAYYGDSWDGYYLRPSKRQYASWVLWMSDFPLWE